ISIATSFHDEGFLVSSSSVNLLITVPPDTNLAIQVTTGDIQIDGVTGLMVVTGHDTTATLRNVVLADGSTLQVANGSVDMQGMLAPNATVDITVSTGDVRLQLPGDTATQLDARTNIGAIHVEGWDTQPVHQNNIGATIKGPLGERPSGALYIRVDTGDITLS